MKGKTQPKFSTTVHLLAIISAIIFKQTFRKKHRQFNFIWSLINLSQWRELDVFDRVSSGPKIHSCGTPTSKIYLLLCWILIMFTLIYHHEFSFSIASKRVCGKRLDINVFLGCISTVAPWQAAQSGTRHSSSLSSNCWNRLSLLSFTFTLRCTYFVPPLPPTLLHIQKHLTNINKGIVNRQCVINCDISMILSLNVKLPVPCLGKHSEVSKRLLLMGNPRVTYTVCGKCRCNMPLR